MGVAIAWKYDISDEDRLFHAHVKSLLDEVIPQISSCVILVYSPTSSLLIHVQPEVNAIRMNGNSPDLKAALITSYHMKCNGYVADSDTADDLLTALGEARLVAVERHNPRILILPNNRLQRSQACVIFKHPEALYIPDMLVATLAEDSKQRMELILLTDPFKENYPTCSTFSHWPSVINDFFPDKTNDLWGKAVRVALLDYAPYTITSPFDGIEPRVIYEFCRKYNCTIALITDEYLWGGIFENGTGNGMLGNVFMDLADFGLGGVLTWDQEYMSVDYSFPYSYTQITLLVPKPARLPEWRVPVLPFSLTMWFMQLFSVLSAAFVMYAVNKASSYMEWVNDIMVVGGEVSTIGGSILRALAMAVLQPPPSRIPTSSPLRVFFTIFEVLFLFFTTLYSGALSSFLTVPMFQPPIDSPRELYDAGIPWTANHIAWTYSLKDTDEVYLKELLKRYEVHDTETLIKLGKGQSGDYGFCIEVMAAGHVTETKHLSGEMILNLHVMKKELYSSYIALVARKGSPYMDKLNELLGRCRDSGLLLLWETDVVVTHMSTRLQTALEISTGLHMEVPEPAQLRLVHVQGTFILLSIGLALSLILFIFEVMKCI